MGPQVVNTRNCIYEDVEGQDPCSGPDEFVTHDTGICGEDAEDIYACEVHFEEVREAFGA